MAIYYVDPMGGSDANGGTDPSTDAWASTAHGLASVAAGDELRLCATGVESVSSAIPMGVSGTDQAKIVVSGANSSGVVDGTRYVLRADAGIGEIITEGGGNYRWSYLLLDGNGLATNCFDGGSNSSGFHAWFDCRFTGATSDAVTFGGHELHRTLWGCEVDHNGGLGITTRSSQRGGFAIHYCNIHHNGESGIEQGDTELVVVGSAVWANDGAGIDCFAVAMRVIGNTIQGNGGDGILTGHEQDSTVFNNSIVSNGGYGLNSAGGNDPHAFGFNHTYNNTSGATNLPGGMPGEGNMTGDPLFADPLNGDFSPGAGSPLLNAGLGVPV